MSKRQEILDAAKQQLIILNDELMDQEMLLVEQLNGVIDEFTQTYQAIISENVAKINTVFHSLSDISNTYVETLTDLVRKVNTTKEELEQNPSLSSLLMDKDILHTAVQNSHDNHLAKILTKEEEIRDREENHWKALCKEIRKQELHRNRQRVAQIGHTIQRYLKAIELKMDEDNDEDDYRPTV